MKKFKKIFAAIAASALVAAMSFTSMAATTVTVKRNEQSGTVNTTYTYYQVLKASVSKDKKNVAYFVENKELKDAIVGLKIKVNKADGTSEDKELFKVSPTPAGTRWNVVPTEYLTSLIKNNETDAAKDIAAAFQTIKRWVPEKNKGVFKNQGETPTAELDDGYYLVESSLGTALVLETAGAKNGTLEITEKNEYPSDTKVVKAPSVMTDDSATYYVTVVVPTTVDPEKKIIVHDKLDAGLSFDKKVKVHVANRTEAADPSTLNDDAFTVLDTTKIEVKTGNADDSCSFHIVIDPSTYVGQKLVFKYTAKLSDSAVTKQKYNNIEYITYNDTEGKAVYTSQQKTVPVVTYGFDLKKVFKDSQDTENDLKATFKLYTDAEYAKGEGAARSPLTFKNSNGYTVSKTGTVTEDITATKDNVINVRGLSAGTYHLVETSTADGYNLLDHDIIIEVTDNKFENGDLNPEGLMHITNGGKPEQTHSVNIENAKGIKLPSTGGMGTTVFAIVGLLVMAGAAVTLIVKKRA